MQLVPAMFVIQSVAILRHVICRCIGHQGKNHAAVGSVW